MFSVRPGTHAGSRTSAVAQSPDAIRETVEKIPATFDLRTGRPARKIDGRAMEPLVPLLFRRV